MKKILAILFCSIALLASCSTPVNPKRYEGCVVLVRRHGFANMFDGDIEVRIKLTDSLSTVYGKEYMWVCMPEWEANKYQKGDTIKVK